MYTRERSDAGTAATMQQFLKLCDRAGPRCVFSGGDPLAKWQTLLTRARRAPIRIPGGPPVTYAKIVISTVKLLADPPESWSALAGQLQQLYEASTPAAGRASPAVAAGGEAAAYDNADEALVAVTCTDTDNPATPSAGQPWPGSATIASVRSDPSGHTCPSLAPPGQRATVTGTPARSTAGPPLLS